MTLGDTEPDAGAGQSTAKVFISYSRRDLDFADRIDAALKARGFDTLIDRSEIYALEDWWKRIEALIAQADTIVFILSPDAVASDVCQSEVRFAASLNKRLAPIVWRRVEDSRVPAELARLNFIFFDGDALFDESLDRLAEALETDIEWVRKHTEFGEHARRWMIAGRPGPRGLLLRPPALDEAERWIASRPANAPLPTEAAQAFITMSRQAHTRRRNIVSASLAAGLFVALGLAGLAYWQRGIAVEQRKIAEERQVGMTAELAERQLSAGRYLGALRTAVQAARRGHDVAGSFPQLANANAELSRVAAHSDWRLILTGHEGPVWSAAFSPDGSRIVTASGDETARVWDAASGKEIVTLRGHEGHLWSAAFSLDGSRIVTASDDKTARVWDAVSGKELLTLRGHDERVVSAAFSPDGSRIVTASWDKTARVWDAASGNSLLTLRGHEDWVQAAAFSPDGSRIVTASDDNTAGVWDAVSGKEITVLLLRGDKGDTLNPLSVAYSPNGSQIIIGSEDKTARVWDAASGKQILTLRGHEGWVLSAVFSPDGTRIVTASDDKTARLWDAASGKEIVALRGHGDVVRSAAFSPDGSRVVTASFDKTARVWDAKSSEQRLIPSQDKEFLDAKSAAYSSDGSRIVTASDDMSRNWEEARRDGSHYTAHVWDAKSGEELLTVRGQEGWVSSATFSPDGSRIVTASADKTARVWDAASGEELLSLRGHENQVWSATFSPDGSRIVTASADKTARVWDAASGKELLALRGHEGPVFWAAYSPDGSRIVTASYDKTARVWDAASGKELLTLRGHEGIVDSATFSPGGSRIVTASWDRTARAWDATNGKEIIVLRGHEGVVRSAAYSPDGSRIVTASDDKTTRLWDAASGKEIIALRGYGNPVMSAAFSPDGSHVVTASYSPLVRDVHVVMMPIDKLLAEVCAHQLRGASAMSRDEMRVIGEPDDAPPIDVCAGTATAAAQPHP